MNEDNDEWKGVMYYGLWPYRRGLSCCFASVGAVSLQSLLVVSPWSVSVGGLF